ncbi:MAG: hypothetical protein RR087_03980, partial [Oscillospiraceae bacterium]
MKHIISKRLISLFLSVILGVSLVVPVMAEVATFSIASPMVSVSVGSATSPLSALGSGVGRATPNNWPGGWPGVATPTDLHGGWDEVFLGNELTIFDATTDRATTRMYMDVGNTAVLSFKTNNTPTLDIENIEFSFTLDSKPFDATNYFN